MTRYTAHSAKLSPEFQHCRAPSTCLILALLIASAGFGQARNPYHLPIISDKKAYEKSIAGKADLKMVRVSAFIQPFYAEVPYATANNFTGTILYQNPTFFLRSIAVSKLKQVQDSLKRRGLSLYFFDAYRPYAVTLKMWEKVPDDRYAANPANGSGHNRGIAVDLTLADLKTGKPLPMPTGFDNFSDTAHYTFQRLPREVLDNRALLRGVMEHFGFIALETEWWHFYLPEPRKYPLMDLSFSQLRKW